MKIQYATWLQRIIGLDEEERDIPLAVNTVSDLLNFLEASGKCYQEAFRQREVIFAEAYGKLLNHNDEILKRADCHITFFSPIVGG